jgi:glycosyltransferase involved in cell wall biosynthesis
VSQPQIHPAVLLVNNKIGGSERRYARFFIAASQMGIDIFLFINSTLYELEIAAGIRIDMCPNVIRLPARCHQLLCGGRLLPFETPNNVRERWFNRCLALARKIDFLLNMGDVWGLAHRLQITHLQAVVGGIYVGFPFFFSERFKTIISVANVDLRAAARKKIGGVPFLFYLLSWFLRRCDAVDAVSPTVKKNLIGQGVWAEKIRVAPCTFTDYERFAPALKKQNWVVFAGRFIELKNPLLFVQAIPQVLNAHPEVQFLMFGAGPLQYPIKQTVARLGVGDVISVRYEPDLAFFLAQSKVFVSIQKDENYSSQSLLEAMACENAVVASDVGETFRWVGEETGVRIESTPESLAAAIIELFDDPELLRRKGKNARQKVLQKHTVDHFARYLLDIYTELA